MGEADSGGAGDSFRFLYLVDDAWLSQEEFLTVDEPPPRFLRCLRKQRQQQLRGRGARGEGEEEEAGEGRASRSSSSSTATPLALPWRHFAHVTFAEGRSSDLVVGGHRVVLPTAADTAAALGLAGG